MRHIATSDEGLRESHFFNILLAGSWMGATDSRDRVYAFLGHPAARRGGHRKTIVEADYEIPKEELFSKLTIKLLKESKSLQALSARRHSEEVVSEGFYSMPSWVKRWDRLSDIVVMGFLVDTTERFYEADLHSQTENLARFAVSVPATSEKPSSAHLRVDAVFADHQHGRRCRVLQSGGCFTRLFPRNG